MPEPKQYLDVFEPTAVMTITSDGPKIRIQFYSGDQTLPTAHQFVLSRVEASRLARFIQASTKSCMDFAKGK